VLTFRPADQQRHDRSRSGFSQRVLWYHKTRVAASIVLVNRATYEVIECTKRQLQIPLFPKTGHSISKLRISARVSDLHVSFRPLTLVEVNNFVDNPWLTLIQPEYLRAPEALLGCT